MDGYLAESFHCGERERLEVQGKGMAESYQERTCMIECFNQKESWAVSK